MPLKVLSVTVRVAERAPVAVGEKVTLTLQVASGATEPEVGQVLVEKEKSPALAPLRAMLEMFRVTVVLVSVRTEVLAGLVVPITTVPKLCEAGTRVAVAVPPPLVPVPLRATVCDPPVALSVTVSVAERVPAAPGVKVTETMQVARALMDPEVGQVVLEASLKSLALVPVMAMLEMLRAAVVLVSVSVED